MGRIDPYSPVPQPPQYGKGIEEVEREQQLEEEALEEELPPVENDERNAEYAEKIEQEEYKGRNVDTYA